MAVSLLLAGFTHAVAGFGFGLVLMSLLPIWLPLEYAVPFAAVFNLVANSLVLWTCRGGIERRRLAPFVIGAVFGVPLGIVFLRAAAPTLLTLILGSLLVCYTVWALLGGDQRSRRISLLWAWPAAFVGGILGGAFNTGGPPVVVFTTLTDWRKEVIKATLVSFFWLSSVIQLSLFVAEARLTLDMLRLQAVMVPALVVGVWLGARVSHRIDPIRFRRLVLGLLLAAGVNFVIRSLL